MKNKLRSHIYLLLLCITFTGQLHADQLGNSGGIENDGEIPIKVFFVYENGEYEWQELARDSFQPFPEKIVSVRVRRAANAFYDTGHSTLKRELKAIVTHRDGEQQIVTEEDEVVVIKPDWGVLDAQKEPMFLIENRP